MLIIITVNGGISIHVPTWGTTMSSGSLFPCILNFNPRSHVGNDVPTLLPIHPIDKISIHVPTWGTTRRDHGSGGEICISIHVPTWGTTEIPKLPYVETIFQSTFPRGERPLTEGKLQVLKAYFNPRSHVGNDSKFSQIFFAFLCNKYNFSTFYYPFSLFFGVIHFTFLIFAVRILPIFYVYF